MYSSFNKFGALVTITAKVIITSTANIWIWSPLGSTAYNGTSNNVNNFKTVMDYKNNCIYLGGNYSMVYDSVNTSGLTANRIAKWDIANNIWKPLGSTASNGNTGIVYALALDSSNNLLYIGGNFTTVKDATNTGGLSANRIAIWDISNNIFKPLSSGANNGTNGDVRSLLLDSSNSLLYVGGAFTTVKDSTTSGLTANRVAIWDIKNNIWRQFGNTTYNGTNDLVFTLHLDSSNNQLYVGGGFTTVQDISNTVALSANRIARWDIANNIWNQLGNTTYNGTSGSVYALALDSSNNQLYIGGNFTKVTDATNSGGLLTNFLAIWDIANNIWRKVGNYPWSGVSDEVRALELDSLNNQLYVGGSFTQSYNSTSLPSKYIGSYNYSTNLMENISTIGSFGSTNYIVSVMLTDYLNNCIYVGGSFTIVYDSTNTGGLSANRVAIWDISNNVWRPFGNTTYNGINGGVNAFALDSSNNQLYVGGGFTTVTDATNVNGLSANYVAIWDISNNIWKQLGNTNYNGTNNQVTSFALDSSNNQLYVGGRFTTVTDATNSGGLSANRMAIWDIKQNIWKQLGNTNYNGTNNHVYALALDSSNNKLYVGGFFTIVYDSTNTGGLSANRVAIWDISNNVWRPLGNTTYNGINSSLNTFALDSSNNQLYVGGFFTTVTDATNVNGLSANYVARWDISNNIWKQLGSGANNGTNSTVNTILLNSSKTEVFVGGDFNIVKDASNTSGLYANFIAMWDISNNIWKQLGNTDYNGTSYNVKSLNLNPSNNKFYIGGSFTSIRSPLTLMTNSLTNWDIYNNVWNPINANLYNGKDLTYVHSINLDYKKRKLYICGLFKTVQDISSTTPFTANNVAILSFM